MKHLRLNQIAIWKPKAIDELTVRESPAGRPYEENNILKPTTAKSYRYAKNYQVGRGRASTKYCLFVITYDNDRESIEKQLDDIAKTITATKARNAISNATNADFEWLGESLKEK